MTAEPREDKAATKKNTEDNTHESPEEEGTRFTDLGLDPRVLSALEEVGYEKPSPIQEQTIPPLLDGNDVVGLAQTGTANRSLRAARALPHGRTCRYQRRFPRHPGACTCPHP